MSYYEIGLLLIGQSHHLEFHPNKQANQDRGILDTFLKLWSSPVICLVAPGQYGRETVERLVWFASLSGDQEVHFGPKAACVPPLAYYMAGLLQHFQEAFLHTHLCCSPNTQVPLHYQNLEICIYTFQRCLIHIVLSSLVRIFSTGPFSGCVALLFHI